MLNSWGVGMTVCLPLGVSIMAPASWAFPQIAKVPSIAVDAARNSRRVPSDMDTSNSGQGITDPQRGHNPGEQEAKFIL